MPTPTPTHLAPTCPICRSPLPAARDRHVSYNGVEACSGDCAERANDLPSCAGPACRRGAVAAGLCASHYQQQRRGQPLAALGLPAGERGARPRLTVRVEIETLRRLRAQGQPSTVAAAVLARWRP